MPTCCVAYTADPAYLFPTFVSAMQARRQAVRDKADVLIFGFGIDDRTADDFTAACAAEGIGFHVVSADVLEGAPAMMARLFLNRFVPAEYRHYVYMDGDTQLAGSLDGLLDAAVRPGRFLAANDPMTFLCPTSETDGRRFADHVAKIGMSPRQGRFYFNTGVLRINRDGWDEIGQAAWRLAQGQSALFRFPDQDPLNVVAADNHTPMSLAWNFPIFMCNAGVEEQIRPTVYHFMSSPKPWQGGFMPWGATALLPYRDAVIRYPALARHNTAFPLGKRVRYHLQQRYKRATEMLTWGRSVRRGRILDYERQVRAAGAA